ncbi:DUF6776 family protein [Pseudomonadota bacterium]
MQKSTDQIVIKPRVPLVTKLVIVISGVLLLAASHWYTYLFGLNQVDIAPLEGEKEALQVELKVLQRRNDGLMESVARAERQLQIDETAYSGLSKSLESSAKQIKELHEELNFYRSIISPTDNRAGIQIQDLSIERSATQYQYHYTLVLIQALKHDQLVRGKVEIKVEGVQGGKKKTLNFSDIGTHSDQISFKYFQSLEGVFKLPSDFMPVRVHVSVRTTRKNARVLERWYPWPTV